jgi:hypothetical protein
MVAYRKQRLNGAGRNCRDFPALALTTDSRHRLAMRPVLPGFGW